LIARGSHVELCLSFDELRTGLESPDDTCNSPSVVLVARLHELGARVIIHDPYVRKYQGDLLKVVQDSDVVVAMVAHEEYRGVDLDDLRGRVAHPVLVDGRNVFSAERAQAAGWVYRG
jgi:UDPglucose 6-dehydrogenase